ncbi:MAG: hypothetical protein CLLPBCKN_007191 [Chroococcidiopsis cubana SAG 39.79]|uniref:Uncharacterized protein n=1 Tax=Chroococcidiopsis cubana SAG 39.79 TaxID=388085 RepID=A0AB37URS9_9CYAN|nr:hypothetical protein [Chroococcidiopsis cubana]MDZ4877756.1 hypothetical protein [Chroococcidiopsis cubana SAG 39.79]PSB62058.1 hypothetical protein C7B79_19650 [Chroococcidiopsis cubana CCALA 043]RUT14040.1 hypothetical protein DSM107010_05230 [Chroococcidiopsis cubana SAG 39.79]
MKIRFLQIIASSAVWMSCHAPAGVASVAPKWEQLQSTNSALLEQVERDYTHDIAPDTPMNVGQMQVSKISKSNSQVLYLVNTRLPGDNNPSCGVSGCLFYGYVTQNDRFVQVLNGYLNDFQVENALPTIQASQIKNHLPCLHLTSAKQQSKELCYNGKTYQLERLTK